LDVPEEKKVGRVQRKGRDLKIKFRVKSVWKWSKKGKNKNSKLFRVRRPLKRRTHLWDLIDRNPLIARGNKKERKHRMFLGETAAKNLKKSNPKLYKFYKEIRQWSIENRDPKMRKKYPIATWE